jgi:hypothetical protein
MFPSRNQRFLVRLHKVVSKYHTELPGKREFHRFLETIDFSAEKLYEKYQIPDIDRGIVERTLTYLKRSNPGTQHRRREINALGMTEYEKALFNAVKQGASVSDLLSTLGFFTREDLLNSITHTELKEVVTELPFSEN